MQASGSNPLDLNNKVIDAGEQKVVDELSAKGNTHKTKSKAPKTPPKMDPTFFDAHPPHMTDEDQDILEQSHSKVIGKPFIILPADFDRVEDPQYDWQNMPHVSPDDFQKWVDAKANKSKDVAAYYVIRERYWNRQGDPKFYPADTTEREMYTVGDIKRVVDTTHQSYTFEQRFEEQLHLAIGAAPTEVPPVPPVGLMADMVPMESMAALNTGGTTINDPGSSSTTTFSVQMTQQLEFTHEEEQTYSVEDQKEVTVNKTAGHYYISWVQQEKLTLYRVPKDKAGADLGQGGDKVQEMITNLDNLYVDVYPPIDPSEGGGL